MRVSDRESHDVGIRIISNGKNSKRDYKMKRRLKESNRESIVKR